MGSQVTYSWILPIRNEAQSLPQLVDEIRQAMTGKRCQIVAVDDASGDRTLAVLKGLRRKLPDIKIIHLSFPWGKWGALQVGIARSYGEVVITSDADLQDDPAEINKLIPYLDRGYDVVSGRRVRRQDSWYKVLISLIGNAIVSLVCGKRFYDLNSPLKIFRREILTAIPKDGSLLRFSLLFAYRMGYRVAEVPISHRPRRYGRSKFGMTKYLRILYDLGLVLLLFSGSGRLYRKQK